MNTENGTTVPRSPYIDVDQAAERYGYTPRTIREKARLKLVPHRKLAGGSAPLLFIPAELDAWADGAALEDVTPRGHPGRVVTIAQNGKER